MWLITLLRIWPKRRLVTFYAALLRKEVPSIWILIMEAWSRVCLLKKNLSHQWYIFFFCLVRISGKYKDIVVYPERTEKFRLGEGCDINIPHGVEKALYKFRSGEGSILYLKGLKYGIPVADYDKFGVPHDAALQFTVELLSHENVIYKYSNARVGHLILNLFNYRAKNLGN
jgi:hypothetical protein